jgi:hypothetical protein
MTGSIRDDSNWTSRENCLELIELSSINIVGVGFYIVISSPIFAALGASTIDSSMYTNVSRGMFSFPNISMEGTKEKLGSRASNSIRYFKNELPIRSGLVQVAWSISEARDTKVPEDETEPFRE